MKITKRTHYWRTFARHCLKSINIDKQAYDLFDQEFSEINQKYANYVSPNSAPTKNIWVFWYQGIEAAPKIVKYCISSIYKNKADAEVILLDKNNYKKYIQIPEYIIEKLNTKKISITHFSDVLRLMILSQYGGVWVDATVFLTKPLEDDCYNLPFYTLHTGGGGLKFAKGRWTTYFQSAHKNSIINCFVRDAYLEYFKKHDYVFDYFIYDYLLSYGYNRLPAFRKLIDDVPISNTGTFSLIPKFNFRYQEERWNKIMSSAYIFKLTYKYTFFKCMKRTIFGQKTIYKHFLETFNLE